MNVLDYRSSFVTYTAAVDGEEKNTCRTQLQAGCTLTDASTNTSVQYHLGKECIGEYMYKDIGIAQVPTSEVAIIISDKESSLQKKFADHTNDVVQSGPVDIRRKGFAGTYAYWTDFHFTLKSVEARPLQNTDEIIDATLAAEALVGRTTLNDTERGWSAILDYPIPYINVHPPGKRFQVDVGPILYPDFTSTAERLVDRLQFAYILYNQLDKAEFALRRATPIGAQQNTETLHYAQVVKVAAQSQLYSLVR